MHRRALASVQFRRRSAMLRTAVALAMAAASVVNAANTETRAELSQARARIVLDRAVEANGGVEALRAIEVVRLRLEGQTFPRLQMTRSEGRRVGKGVDIGGRRSGARNRKT